MEGWQYELDHTERPEIVLPGTGHRVLSRRVDIDGTGICLVGSLYAKETQPDSCQSQSKYWIRTHKFGVRIPKSVQEAKELDHQNGNSMWWEAICKEMKNVRLAFEVWEKDISHIPPGYQQIKCHMVFDVKMGENFRSKARFVVGGHATETPSTLTYSSVVSRDSVRIILLVAALNGLNIMACDIQNAYLTVDCCEKIWTIAGPEFRSEKGTPMVIRKSLYGLKSSGAVFEVHLAKTLYDIGFRSSKADPDVSIRPAVKPNGQTYTTAAFGPVKQILMSGLGRR